MISFNEIRKLAVDDWQKLENIGKPRILVGAGTCGRAAGSESIQRCIESTLAKRGLDATIIEVGCLGPCYAEPMVGIIKPGYSQIIYGNLTADIITQIISDYLIGQNPHPELAFGYIGKEPVDGIPNLFELPSFKPQVRIVLRNCGLIDPQNINHYIANDGYSGFERALSTSPDEVIDEIKKAGLRGRGGAGFPTGQKWEFCRKSPGSQKYIICNADEGDPGAFMNRSLIEGDPHSLLEGMLIGAYAIGASEGYIYCRAEYPLALQRLRLSIKQMEDYDLIGDNILGSDFSFHLHIKEGAGAFVCGEETALMASIEGKRGMPTSRPPFPAVFGLWGKPTNINNVETWVNAAVIMQKGSNWYSQFGTENSKGTKTFALVGKVEKTGLIEVPFGITLRKIIYEIGQGIAGGKRFKAVQTGGPSGGCIPTSLLDLPVDYQSLTAVGSIMGSGGMIVADENTCMVDLTRYFLSFTQAESCGKCTPCRVGTKQMLSILERITNGQGVIEDIEKLEQIADTVKNGSLCGLGQTSPNPVLTTLKYFREEYEEHIIAKHCRAATCKGLVKAPCSHTCPAEIDVPRYIRFILQNKFSEAAAVIREKVPFPRVLGRVCFHPCESKCRRREIDEAIDIKNLKRAAADYDTGLWRQNAIKYPATGKRIAVIGSGPAGLTAAYYMAKLGHTVTVFESFALAGGMMRVGIPEYRLPRQILDLEIEEIKNVGVNIKTNTKIESLKSLFDEGYSAILLAIGAHRGMKLGIPGEDLDGVLECVDFLRNVNLGKKVRIGDRVSVIGGGNAAIDSARTAQRLGASNVVILYRRTRDEMPANPEEIEEALKEGVRLEYLSTPNRISSNNGCLNLQITRMKLGEFDNSGRRKPEPIKGSEFSMEFDNIIAAIGQSPDIPESFDLTVRQGNTIQVDKYSLATAKNGVFAGGDCISGPASVIEAIADGRKGAIAIDKYLGGKGDIKEVLAPLEDLRGLPDIQEGDKQLRSKHKTVSLQKRLHSFDEVELCLSKKLAIKESKRCLRCDLENR